MSTQLPDTLAPWSASLGFLTVEAAEHIGPLVARLDALFQRHDPGLGDLGDPDGYDGLSTRGQPEQIVLSEWLLADELPVEFLRRAAARELLHVNPAFREPQPRGRIAAYFDPGPEHFGAPRLVALAALIVLHRRALDRGSQLQINIDDRWHAGDLRTLFNAWRGNRSLVPYVEQAALERQLGQLDAPDELWIFAGPTLAAAKPRHRLLVRVTESAWDDRGPTHVDVRFAGRTVTLPLPSPELGVRTLRGGTLRAFRSGPKPSAAGPGAFGPPVFWSDDRRLLMHGENERTLVSAWLPYSGDRIDYETHTLPPVIAAAGFRKYRVGMLVDRDGAVEFDTIGRPFGGFNGKRMALMSRFDPAPAGLAPLFFDHSRLLTRLGDRWWHLVPGQPPDPCPEIVGVGPSNEAHVPFVIALRAGNLIVANTGIPVARQVNALALQVVTARSSFAFSTSPTVWRQFGPYANPDVEVYVPTGETVLGLTNRVDREPELITVDANGQIRRRRDGAADTLPNCSGHAQALAVHPGLPLLAVQREPGRVEIYDHSNDERLFELVAGHD